MKRFILILLCVITAACGIDRQDEDEMLVIDGWIDSGGRPVVMVSSTLAVSSESISMDELESHVENWARVSISDGEEEEVLLGKRDDNYFPPYIYTSTRLRGEEGKTYTIEAYSKGRTVKARTSIPKAAELTNIRAVRSKDKDSLYTICADLKEKPAGKACYKVFTMIEGKDSTYKPSFFGNFDETNFGPGENSLDILPPVTQKWRDFDSYFHSGDKVRIKFCTMDEDAYAYWCGFEEILTLSRNPMFPVTRSLRSNVEGGLGLWAGYGASFYTIDIP